MKISLVSFGFRPNAIITQLIKSRIGVILSRTDESKRSEDELTFKKNVPIFSLYPRNHWSALLERKIKNVKIFISPIVCHARLVQFHFFFLVFLFLVTNSIVSTYVTSAKRFYLLQKMFKSQRTMKMLCKILIWMRKIDDVERNACSLFIEWFIDLICILLCYKIMG